MRVRRVVCIGLLGALIGCDGTGFPIVTTGGASESSGDSDDRDGDGSLVPDDCNDWNARVAPGLPELQDGFDNDCNGQIDEGQPTQTGYQGYGSEAVGGAGGELVIVTSLADSGPGTLREAVEDRTGPVRVEFDVAGEIALASSIRVSQPFITIDGASAREPGVTLVKTDKDEALIVVQGTHDVIVSHLAMRGLWQPGLGDDTNASLIIVDGDSSPDSLSQHVVLDHLTASFAFDGGIDVWAEVRDVTVSFCVIHSSLQAMSISYDVQGVGPPQARQRVSVHHNLFTGNIADNPQLKGDMAEIEVVGNVIHAWGDAQQEDAGGILVRNEADEPSVSANIVGNALLPTRSAAWSIVYGQSPGADSLDGGGALLGQLWVADNLFPAESLDNYSTIEAPLPIPERAQVVTWSPRDLDKAMLPWVGVQYPSAQATSMIADAEAALVDAP